MHDMKECSQPPWIAASDVSRTISFRRRDTHQLRPATPTLWRTIGATPGQQVRKCLLLKFVERETHLVGLMLVGKPTATRLEAKLLAEGKKEAGLGANKTDHNTADAFPSVFLKRLPKSNQRLHWIPHSHEERTQHTGKRYAR